jgi:uncharacterized Zn ribbon protein
MLDKVKIMSSGKDFGTKFLCPICKTTYVDFEKSIFSCSEDWSNWDGRGQAIKIPMECENGHNWIFQIGFHKGETFICCKHDGFLPMITEIE